MKKETKKNTELAVPNEIQQKESASVEGFIAKAIESNLPVETMEKLFNLREKVKKEQAKESFVNAMSLFQSECPVIKKTKKVLNKDGRTLRYMFAPLDSIVTQIGKPLAKNNLAYTWEVKNDEGFITAICKITHALGHSETSEFKVPIDTEGYMTAPQKYASALTFAKRYSLCNALGISTGDEDTDAVDVEKEADVKSKKAKIMIQLRTLKENTTNKEAIEKAVLRLAKLELRDENFDEITGRLQVLIDESNENSKV